MAKPRGMTPVLVACLSLTKYFLGSSLVLLLLRRGCSSRPGIPRTPDFSQFLEIPNYLLNRPTYLPPQWSAYTHPEGQLYFFRHAALRIVTEAYIYHPDIMAKVGDWSRVIEDLIAQKHIVLSDNVELFLQIEDNDCAYYFVDHATRIEFWLEELNTDDLNIPAVVSPSHLRQNISRVSHAKC